VRAVEKLDVFESTQTKLCVGVVCVLVQCSYILYAFL